MITERTSAAAIIVLLAADVWLWYEMASGGIRPQLATLDVGQGDSTLLVLRNGGTILVDAGPDGRVIRSLERVFPRWKRRIDLAVITHPQLDHYGGLLDILRRYEIGAIIVNGRDADSAELGSPWRELSNEIAARKIPVIALGAGGRIRQGNDLLTTVSPTAQLRGSAELNDTALVLHAKTAFGAVLLAADIGTSVEDELITRYGSMLRADVLKIGHHGSKYSTGEAFIATVKPHVVTISSGRGNRHGHPAPETLARIAAYGNITVFRTDTQGTIRIEASPGKGLTVFTER